ncbi:MAG: DUF3426 domain-containing protein, partial [Alphaproteobacteria bacterium]|nr:DUF3426 domain-containing protein [Alphaproteobacteria bacterium]
DSLFGDAPKAQPKAEEKPAAAPEPAPAASAAKDEGPPLSQEELDKVFAATPEPEPIESVVSEGGKKDGDEAGSVEDLPEPEPIPQVVAPPDTDAGGTRRSRLGLIAALLLLIIVGGAFAGVFFARETVTRLVPKAKEIYSMLGMSGEAVGAGLDIRSVTSERANESGVEVLIVRGVITNVSTVDRPVPGLKVILFDANNRPTQSASAMPAKDALPAGGEIGFRISMRDPSPLARRLEVTFAEAPKDAPATPDATKEPPAKEPAPQPDAAKQGAEPPKSQ